MTLLQETLFHQFHHCVNLLRRGHHHGGHGEGGMHHGQGKLLSLLQDNDGISQKALTDMLQIRRASVAELLDKLESNSLISRRPNATDGRTFDVFLTEKGDSVASEHRNERGKAAARLFSALSTEEQAQLSGLFGKLIAALEPEPGEAGCPEHHDHCGPHGHHEHHGHHHGPHPHAHPHGRRHH